MKLNKYLLLVLFPALLLGQEQLLIDGKVSHGGFGGPVVKFSQFDGEWATLTGGRGAWVLNHVFTIGGAGYSIVTDTKVNGFPESDKYPYLELNYGGPQLGFIYKSDNLIHGTFNILLGFGESAYRGSLLDLDDQVDFWNKYVDRVVVVEPELSVEMNITRFFRIGSTVSYRKVLSIDEDKYYPTKNYLDGVAVGVEFKFGKF